MNGLTDGLIDLLLTATRIGVSLDENSMRSRISFSRCDGGSLVGVGSLVLWRREPSGGPVGIIPPPPPPPPPPPEW